MTSTSEQPKPQPLKYRRVGIRNICTDGLTWKYLLFYDVDDVNEADLRELYDLLESFNISYLVYQTKNGIHVVGLTPLDIMSYAYQFDCVKRCLPEYYSGQVIRLSRKQNEKQEVVYYNFDYPAIENLLSLYYDRFPELKGRLKQPITLEKPYVKGKGYTLVFESYWSAKE